MIEKQDVGKIMNFVASRWVAESRDPDSKVLAELPNDFWMNSVGGKTANGGFWVTSLMYTENEADAAAFREVLLRWQSKGVNKNDDGGQLGARGGGTTSERGPDLIRISKMKKDPNSTTSSTDNDPQKNK